MGSRRAGDPRLGTIARVNPGAPGTHATQGSQTFVNWGCASVFRTSWAATLGR
jgi:hypothetical protein